MKESPLDESKLKVGALFLSLSARRPSSQPQSLLRFACFAPWFGAAIFSAPWDRCEHHSREVWWDGPGGRDGALGRAESNTKRFQRTLSLGAPAKSRAATI